MKTKFKVGDKVRILPSAIDINVAESEVGAMGKIITVRNQESICVDTVTKKYLFWVVRGRDIEPVIKVGQQLQFDFMK
ncbi:hypothetical protein LCGC14_0404250 [marine sediment metagenome]|uniref:KOW domain-containing protein n=1 Tax=marine sediment metagenome TaxID=412755 RepID=A0A0F9VHX3_9ZZZZ